MGEKITLQQAESILETKYKGVVCSFSYPGYDTVYGKVDQIAIETVKSEPQVVIQMNSKRYTCSPDSLRDCLKVLKYKPV